MKLSEATKRFDGLVAMLAAEMDDSDYELFWEYVAEQNECDDAHDRLADKAGVDEE